MPTPSTLKDDLVINLYNRLKACFGRSPSKQAAVEIARIAVHDWRQAAKSN
ncbi:hypothetical protein ACU5P1_11550 [Pseudomonas plecoglossicida]|nr:hypothetical protein [Pseudomonas plecoglossicida]QLB55409.1 hypothetical protein HAV28_11460 [Pseudomonas plecoglossicida]GLR38850.1 hypothetical protein GCM10011247_42490 [Pseudomonas plecoglossicida]